MFACCCARNSPSRSKPLKPGKQDHSLTDSAIEPEPPRPRQPKLAAQDQTLAVPVNEPEPSRLNDSSIQEGSLEDLEASAVRLVDLRNEQTEPEQPDPPHHLQFTPAFQITRVETQRKYPWNSSSSTPEIKPLRRAKTFSRFSSEVKVLVRTQFRNFNRSEPITFPRDSTISDTYKHIESITKAFAEEQCGGFDPRYELSLFEGFCTISCPGGEDCRPFVLEQEPIPLLSEQDWAEIETLVANYENDEDGREGHKHMEISITRKLELTKKPKPLTMVPAGSIRFWLWQQLEKGMKKSGAAKHLLYIPKDELESLTAKDIVVPLVEHEATSLAVALPERTKLAAKIYQGAPILLAIFVYSRLSLDLLEEMIAHGMSDQDLPLTAPSLDWIPEDTLHWQSYRVLLYQQWSFTAAVFHPIGDRHQDFVPNIIIPFLSKEEIAHGAFSIVYRVQIEQSHQRLYALKKNPNPALALKVIDHRKTSADAFQNEQLILNGLQELTHDHIIKLLATYQQEGIYHFLFPLADCSLEKYMHHDPIGFKDPDPQASKQFTAWIIGQFQGIASGLAKIHVNSGDNSSKKIGDTLGKELRPQLLVPSVAQRQRPEGTGYHHDIKPQNILHFPAMADTQNPTSDYGIFQIADFGIGKFHSLNSGTGTGTFRGTPTYAAPESKVFVKSHTEDKKNSKPGLKLSRPYDIWSLGCVLLEVAVWLVFGKDGLKDFDDERFGPERAIDSGSVETNGFFILTGDDGPQIRKTVRSWMNKLREHPRLHKNTGASLLGLLNLIEEKILVCDPEKRLIAEDVERGLSELTRMAAKEAAEGEGVEALSTIVEVPSNEGDPLNGSEIQPPSRTSSPFVRVHTPEMVNAESAATSTSNSPKRKSANNTDFKMSHSLANPRPGSTSHLPQLPANPTKMPPPSRSSTLKSATTGHSSRRGSDASTSSSLRVQKYESHTPDSPQ
ncbi:hypothetical protein BGZ57DRAFT_861391 [Hyaloscypha finlandica]|nr:hypothetical protein BGZ57DRAFT_861391 [Hyaloscypha finlandica]